MSQKKNLSMGEKIESIKRKINIKQIADIVLIVVLLIFAVQNLKSIRVNLLFFRFEMPLFFLIVIIFFIGFFTAKYFSKRRKA